jgi:anti-sigma B factor antagonist
VDGGLYATEAEQEGDANRELWVWVRICIRNGPRTIPLRHGNILTAGCGSQRLFWHCKNARGQYNSSDFWVLTLTGIFSREGVAMATNPVSVPELSLTTATTPTEVIVDCSGKITSNTIEFLKATVKPLFSENKTVVLDLTNVSFMDSSGLGAIIGLFVSAKAAKSGLKLINLNERLKELFSITRLGQFLTEGRDPRDLTPP